MALRILIGADPEVFVREKASGRFVSAHDLMPGTKFEPHKVTHGAIQVDGVAAEFNIDPAETVSQFTGNISTVTTELQKYIGEKYELVSQPTVLFPEDYFKSLPETVRELGCNPDFNAWTGQVNDKPNGDGTTMRTGAGHIHVGWTKDVDPTDKIHFDDCAAIARQMDYYLGLYSLMWDPDVNRRKLYGKAGSFRPKPYGMEYRPLSNLWLRSFKLQDWVYKASVKSVSDLIQNNTQMEDEFKDLARGVIDNSEVWWTEEARQSSKDHSKLQKLLKLTGLNLPPKLPEKSVIQKVPTRVKARFFSKHPANGKSYARSSKEGPYLESADSGHLIQTDSEGFLIMPNQALEHNLDNLFQSQD